MGAWCSLINDANRIVALWPPAKRQVRGAELLHESLQQSDIGTIAVRRATPATKICFSSKKQKRS